MGVQGWVLRVEDLGRLCCRALNNIIIARVCGCGVVEDRMMHGCLPGCLPDDMATLPCMHVCMPVCLHGCMGVCVCQVLCPEGQYDELATLLWGHHEDALVRILTQVSGDDVHMDG